jgi:ammonium transporter Rh
MSEGKVFDLQALVALQAAYQTETSAPAPASSSLEQPSSQILSDVLTAASSGDLYKLTAYGAKYDLDVGDYDRRTALHLAASEGHTVLVAYLISRKVNVNCEDRWGNTPLREALRSNHLDCVKILKQAGATMGATSDMDAEIFRAASTNDVKGLQALVDAGGNVNCKDYDGRTPLHVAVSDGHKEVVMFLLSRNADPNALDRWENTPLSDAMRVGIRVGKDEITELLLSNGAKPHERENEQLSPHFPVLYGIMQVICIILFGIFVQYGPGAASVTPGSAEYPGDTAEEQAKSAQVLVDDFGKRYPLFQDIHVMIFVGFGYLMTFLRKYGYTAVGFTLLIGAFVMQWHIINEEFWHAVFKNKWHYIQINIGDFIRADFSAAAVLITFGALIGKTSPTQMLCIAIFEVIFYNINENIALHIGVSDVGGSYVIHMFGAYFGLACSKVLSPASASGRSDNAPVYHSDLFAMIGTVYLWMYWPSFNAGPQTGVPVQRAVVNTLLSMSGSCGAGFLFSKVLRVDKKFNMVDIQNATLAGGVAIGAVADMLVYPVGAILIGAAGGIISVVGYNKITPYLEGKLGLHDTCGIHNLHGMPSLISAISACIIAAAAQEVAYGADLSGVYVKRPSRSATEQAQMQTAFLFITLGISMLGGAFTGFIAKQQWFDPMFDGHLFLDMESWEVPHLETPYYFDQRGEVGRKAIQNDEKQGGADNRTVDARTGQKSEHAVHGDAFAQIVDRLDVIMSEISIGRLQKAKTK